MENKNTAVQSSQKTKKARAAEFRNIGFTQILTYRLPLAGWVSIFHRLSGASLFLVLPFILVLFEYSLKSESSFLTLKRWVANGGMKCIILVLATAMVFHLLAGVRYLCIDLHYAVGRQGSQRSALMVLVLSGIFMVAVAAKLFGVF